MNILLNILRVVSSTCFVAGIGIFVFNKLRSDERKRKVKFTVLDEDESIHINISVDQDEIQQSLESTINQMAIAMQVSGVQLQQGMSGIEISGIAIGEYAARHAGFERTVARAMQEVAAECFESEEQESGSMELRSEEEISRMQSCGYWSGCGGGLYSMGKFPKCAVNPAGKCIECKDWEPK